MTFIQLVAIGILLSFVVPFFIYLFSRLQMTAWLNAFDLWITKKGDSTVSKHTKED